MKSGMDMGGKISRVRLYIFWEREKNAHCKIKAAGGCEKKACSVRLFLSQTSPAPICLLFLGVASYLLSPLIPWASIMISGDFSQLLCPELSCELGNSGTD